MAIINIPIHIGDNYISFPATDPTENFETILTNSQIKNSILDFTKYDPILLKMISINYLYDYIEEGVGYYIYSISEGNITYDGIPYILTFDQLKSKILKGWNLLATGDNTIILPSWCYVIDANTRLNVTQLEPKKAYWINSDDCLQPTFNAESALYVIGAIGSILLTVYFLREFRIIGEPLRND